jgi:hypothetical protein
MPRESFSQVVAAAISDISEHGFDTETRLQMWVQRILQAAHLSMASASSVENTLRRALTAKYNQLITPGAARRYHRGMDRFTLQRVAPAARAELDRRILASVQLIKLNREEAMAKTIRRFSGWATSIPVGGADVAKREEAKEVKKALGSLPFETRRCIIDQNSKMVASINAIIAKNGGAIAGKWEHVHQAGYDGRPEHIARDQHIYLLRPTWATERGLVKPNKDGWYDGIDAVGEKIYCRCWLTYIYRLSELPDDMITAKGQEVIHDAKTSVTLWRQNDISSLDNPTP